MEEKKIVDIEELAYNTKEEITNLCLRYGYDLLLNKLIDTDFFRAPASTKYHGSFVGGLALHSLNVFNELRILLSMKKIAGVEDYEIEDVAFKLAICHDLCKINVYKTELRNTKNERGEWIKVPYYTFEDKLPYGHGEKSVLLAELWGVELTTHEKMAIRWHMGAFDNAVKGGFNLSPVFENYPLALYLHIADMLATYGGQENG